MSNVRRLRGPSLRSVAKQLQTMPRVIAIGVASASAALITAAAQGTFDAGLTAYGDTRPLTSTGKKATLVKTGRARATALRFWSDGGTRLRASVTEKYMGILVGVFKILPIGVGGLLPRRWGRILEEQTRIAGESHLRRAA